MTTGGRVLVVDDNELVLALVERPLVLAGFVVEQASSGYEMMQRLRGSRPDVIVLDLGLPDMDGRDLLAALKKDSRTKSIPVIVWSGGRGDANRRIALELGAEDYVEKGPPSTLVSKIERVLLRVSEGQLATARSTIPASRS